MIGSLRGKVLRIDGTTALIEAGGVGYEVEMPVSSLQQVSAKKDGEVFVYIHHSVREDAHVLYGFSDYDSRSIFRTLIKVNGIGPRSALAALSTFDASSLASAVAEGRTSALCQIPGIGKKTAERIIVELKDKLAKFGSSDLNSGDLRQGEAFDEAVEAMVSLGYKESLAIEYCKAAYKSGMSVEDTLKAALALVTKNRGR